MTQLLASGAKAQDAGGLFDEAAHRFAERTMIEFDGCPLSFGDMAVAVTNVAAALAGRGVGKGDRIALYLPNTPHYPVLFFAAMRLGAVVVNLTPLDAVRELRFKLADTGARIVATLDAEPFRGNAAALLDEGVVDLVLVGSDAYWHGADPVAVTAAGMASLDAMIATTLSCPAVHVTRDDLALIQYTGGTTGTPKGAMIAHGNLVSAVAMFDAAISVTSGWRPGCERHIGVLPLFHI
jgi:long-chain acyl-CoA synthetase